MISKSWRTLKGIIILISNHLITSATAYTISVEIRHGGYIPAVDCHTERAKPASPSFDAIKDKYWSVVSKHQFLLIFFILSVLWVECYGERRRGGGIEPTISGLFFVFFEKSGSNCNLLNGRLRLWPCTLIYSYMYVHICVCAGRIELATSQTIDWCLANYTHQYTYTYIMARL